MPDVFIGEVPVGPSPRRVLEQKHRDGRAMLGELLIQERTVRQQIETLERELASLALAASLFPE